VALEQPEQLFDKQLVKKLFVPLMLGVLAYAALLFYGDAASVGAGLRHLNGGALVLGAGLSIAGFALRGGRWEFFLRVMGIRVPWRESALAFLAGLGMSITPGKVGELLKALLLKEAADVPVARSAPIIVAERIMDLASLLALGIGGFLWSRGPLVGMFAGAIVVAAFFALGRSRTVALALIGILAKIPFVARFREKLETAHASLYELWGATAYSLGMALSLVAWGLQATIVVVLAAALPDTHVSLPQAFVAYSAPLLAGTLALLPGGLGLTEASMTGVLRAMSGATPAAAAVLTIVLRGLTFWLAVTIGFSALAVSRARRRHAVTHPAGTS